MLFVSIGTELFGCSWWRPLMQHFLVLRKWISRVVVELGNKGKSLLEHFGSHRYASDLHHQGRILLKTKNCRRNEVSILLAIISYLYSVYCKYYHQAFTAAHHADINLPDCCLLIFMALLYGLAHAPWLELLIYWYRESVGCALKPFLINKMGRLRKWAADSDKSCLLSF